MLDNFITLMQTDIVFLTIFLFVFGLLVGSFLNVVIYRSPVMLFREWESMAKDILKERGFTIKQPKQPIDNEPENFNLISPRSRCRQCGHQVKASENIPLLSYIFLKGKCSQCKTSISSRYPFVELLTAIIFVLAGREFGFGWPLIFVLLISAYFIAMSFIDIDHQILPDNFTLPLLWFALILATSNTFISLYDAVIGAIAGYMVLWSIYWLFKLLTGKEGMGYGDFKLLAVIGALVGWQKLGIVIILSAGVGAILGILMILLQNKDSQTKIPFGPYLATAGWITLLWGDMIQQKYLQYMGLN